MNAKCYNIAYIFFGGVAMRNLDHQANNRIFINFDPENPMEVKSCTYSNPPVNDNGLSLRRGVFGGQRKGEDDFEQHKRDLRDAFDDEDKDQER